MNQLDGAVHPGAFQIAIGRIQHRVSGKKRPAQIKAASYQSKPGSEIMDRKDYAESK